MIPLTVPGFTSTLSEWLSSKEDEAKAAQVQISRLEEALADRDETIGNYSNRLADANADRERLMKTVEGLTDRVRKAEKKVKILCEVRIGLLDQDGELQEVQEEVERLKKVG